ncbi:sugar ABC transporter substrate-binding protein [Castellaniella sp.]|uniref:sugar ABC transporter substrate-binding protein n=1 Tax=Castellaniella sp. TaxID=1955812 RepID=UPI003565E0F5
MKKACAFVLAASMAAFAGHALAQGKFVDELAEQYTQDVKGKRVAFLALSTSFDLAQMWSRGMEKFAERNGIDYTVRNPNWDSQAGSQALTDLIRDKYDLLVVQNPDVQVYRKLLNRAQKAGIPVVQINLKSLQSTDAFVGAEWAELGRMQAQIAYDWCAKEKGGSGEVALMQGTPTNPNTLLMVQGVKDIIEQHPGQLEIVSNQVADFDATKAHGIASTVIKQHPNLCAYIGTWDGMDLGVASAVEDAGKIKDIKVITNGGGRQPQCDRVRKGLYDAYISYNAFRQAQDLTVTMAQLLQNGHNPDVKPYAIYTPLTVITQENLNDDSCWDFDKVEKTEF